MARLDALALALDPENGPRTEAALFNAQYGDRDAASLVALAVEELFPGRIAAVSSFGAESAVLLHMVSEVDRTLPVVFLDTGRLFSETLEYRNRLGRRLGLTDVRTVAPNPGRLAESDPYRALWMTDPDLCCAVRKAEPLERALGGFDAWFTGRKRFQNGARAGMPVFEADGHQRIKVNPLASWAAADLRDYAMRHDLPPHPLLARGYASIGCAPCTTCIRAGEDGRAGRWRGRDKTECGIHAGFETAGSGI